MILYKVREYALSGRESERQKCVVKYRAETPVMVVNNKRKTPSRRLRLTRHDRDAQHVEAREFSWHSPGIQQACHFVQG